MSHGSPSTMKRMLHCSLSATRRRVARAGLAVALLAAACGGGPGGGIHARLGHSPETGLRVVEVPADGPAARAGLERGDVIVAIDGEPVEGLTPAQIHRRLGGLVGSTVELRIDRAGRPMTLEVTRAAYDD